MAHATGADTTRITAPTLVVSGSADTRVPPVVGDAIAAQIAGARLVTLADCPLGLADNQPQAIADLLADCNPVP